MPTWAPFSAGALRPSPAVLFLTWIRLARPNSSRGARCLPNATAIVFFPTRCCANWCRAGKVSTAASRPPNARRNSTPAIARVLTVHFLLALEPGLAFADDNTRAKISPQMRTIKLLVLQQALESGLVLMRAADEPQKDALHPVRTMAHQWRPVRGSRISPKHKVSQHRQY